MKILLYSINFYPELTGIGKYNGEMAVWFQAADSQVDVVTSPPYYPAWQVVTPYENKFLEEKLSGVTVLRCPLYVPKALSTVKRILHLASFAVSSIVGLWQARRFKPDVVLMVEPTLFCAPAGLLFAKLMGAKTVLHVQDYEIDAMLGLGLMDSGVLPRLAHSIETWFMRRYDRVSTISNSMMRLAIRKGVDQRNVIFFPNWVDTEFISPDADKDHFRQLWDIPATTKVVMYSGNMGKKQGLELVLQAALALRDRKDLLFLLVGQGAAKDDLVAQTKSMGLTNVRFEPLQDYIYLPALLVLPDVHLVVQKKGAADVVLPSKLTGILSAGGHALITAESETELGILCQQHPGIGTCVEPESLPAFLNGLEQLLATDTRAVNLVARCYAEEYLNKDAVLARFQQDLQALVTDAPNQWADKPA